MTAANPGLDVLFLSGPPFGPELFRQVVARLGFGSAESVIDPQHPDDGWPEAAARLAERLRKRPTVVVAHGLAVPAAVAAALAAPPAGLVLTNGPVRRLDPFAAALSRVTAAPGGRALAAATLLRPRPWLGWLASSAGLRRAVVNPYVMDRDTVATLCGPLVASAAGRRATAAWLASLRDLPDATALRCPVFLPWGDGDPLYPAAEASFLEAALPGARHESIPGGQHGHPEERPWELADRVGAWLSDQGARAPSATRVS